MDKTQIIREVLEEQWPDHVQILGERAVREIAAEAAAERTPAYTPATGGHNIDPSALLGIVSNLASIVASILSVVVMLRVQGKLPPGEDPGGQAAAVMEHLPSPTGLEDEEMRAIMDGILRRAGRTRNDGD